MNREAHATGALARLAQRLALLAAGFALVQLAYAYWPTVEVRGAARLSVQVEREYAQVGAFARPAVQEAIAAARRLLRAAAVQVRGDAVAVEEDPRGRRLGRELREALRPLGDRLALRLGVLAVLVPLYLLAGVVAVVDGCCARRVRRLAGGRESSFVYHRVKCALWSLAFAAVALYLWSPWPIDPRPVFACHAGFHLILLRQWAASFKKYL